MNLNSISSLFFLVALTFFNFVFAVENEELLLKEIVSFLPKACKELNGRGIFSVFSPSDYDCMFESREAAEYIKAAHVLVLLTQLGEKKLAQEVSKSWVKSSRWGPFNQDEIIDQLMLVISVRPSAFNKIKKKDSADSSIVELESVYNAFKILHDVGKDLIVPGPMHKHLIAKIIKVAGRVDTTEKMCTETVSNVIWTLLSIAPIKVSQVKAIADVYLAIQTLNSLVEDGEIKKDAWDVYAPFICAAVNKQFSTDFSVVDGKKSSAIKISSKFAEETTDSILKVTFKVQSKSSPSSSTFLNSAEPSSTGFWLCVSGIAVLSLMIMIGFYYAYIVPKKEDL